MIRVTDRLRTLKASDVMTPNVVQISANQTMNEAAATFEQHSISSVPVCDELGRCIGILSIADFLRWNRLRQPRDQGPYCHVLVHGNQSLQIVASSVDSVRHYMTHAVQSISVGETLLETARTMIGGHLHHLPVIDHDGRALGMVSTMDVVAAMVTAVEELKTKSRRPSPELR